MPVELDPHSPLQASAIPLLAEQNEWSRGVVVLAPKVKNGPIPVPLFSGTEPPVYIGFL